MIPETYILLWAGVSRLKALAGQLLTTRYYSFLRTVIRTGKGSSIFQASTVSTRKMGRKGEGSKLNNVYSPGNWHESRSHLLPYTSFPKESKSYSDSVQQFSDKNALMTFVIQYRVQRITYIRVNYQGIKIKMFKNHCCVFSMCPCFQTNTYHYLSFNPFPFLQIPL